MQSMKLYSRHRTFIASYVNCCLIFTPHAQRERGKVIGRGVHIYIYIYIYMSVVKKKI